MKKIAQEQTQREILDFLKNPTVTSDFGIAVQMGLIDGVSFINKFGRNPATATGDCIWQNSTAYSTPASAEVCNIVSTSVQDNPAGTGLGTMFVVGINDLYDLVSETITLNGTTNVLTKNKYWGIIRAYGLKPGTGGTEAGAVGTITIISTAASTPTLGTIVIGINQTQSSVFIVPRGYTAFFNLPQVTAQNTGVNNSIALALVRKNVGEVFRVVIDYLFLSDSGGNYQQKKFSAPISFPSMCTIFYKCITAAASYDVVVDYDIWLVKNELLIKR